MLVGVRGTDITRGAFVISSAVATAFEGRAATTVGALWSACSQEERERQMKAPPRRRL